MQYTGVVYDVAPGDHLIIQHSMNVVPYRANTTIDNQMILSSPTPLSGTNSSNGDWYYDHSTSLFSFIGQERSFFTVQCSSSFSFS